MSNQLPVDIAALVEHEPATPFRQLDMDAALNREDYNAQVRPLQLEMVHLQRRVGDYGLRVILIFEGMDAAGKGGAIRRLTQHLDPRGYRVHSLGPPSQIDASQHYLRRFWMRLPKRGRITIFDDYSWYGRMLMEPIEGFCTQAEHERAGRQIRDFELMLAEEQYLLLKFWIQVSRDEQFKRFKRRLDNPYKSWKLTPEDWRNRQKYDEYSEHAREMIKTTSAPYAPWYVIAGNDKLLARVSVLKITTDALRGYPVDTTPYSHRFEQLHWLEEHGGESLDD